MKCTYIYVSNHIAKNWKLGKHFIFEQDPVSTMQKTGWTNHSSFLVLLSGFQFGWIHWGAVNNHFPVIWLFLSWWQTNKQTNDQIGDPSASVLSTSEKAVFCKIYQFTFHTLSYLAVQNTSLNDLVCLLDRPLVSDNWQSEPFEQYFIIPVLTSSISGNLFLETLLTLDSLVIRLRLLDALASLDFKL